MSIFAQAGLNLEISVPLGRYSAFAINFNPTKKEYSWTLYIKKNNELKPVQPQRITGELKTWDSREAAVADIEEYISDGGNRNER